MAAKKTTKKKQTTKKTVDPKWKNAHLSPFGPPEDDESEPSPFGRPPEDEDED
jgi:hypothetical protein